MAVAETYYKRGEGNVWIQPSGPFSNFSYLQCAGLDGFSRAEGDLTLLYCKDPANAGGFIVRDSVQGVQGPVTTSMVIPFGKLTNYVLSLKCKFNLQVRFQTCNRPDDATAWEKALHFHGVRITTRSSDGLAARVPTDNTEILSTMALSAEEIYELNDLTLVRQTTAETNAINDLSFISEERCDGLCGTALAQCQTGYAVCDRTGATTANVLKTTNGGGTWAATAADPFAASEDISSVVTNSSRVIAARLTADAANPAEIAYSDDSGVAWTLVNVGTTNNQTIQRLFWLSQPYLWVAASGGYVYFSSDSGLTWTTQDAGVATAQTLQDINFSDAYNGVAVGNSNAVIRTYDGGTTWSAVTGPAAAVVLNSVHVIAKDKYFVGAANGNLYYTSDGGVTWTTVGINSAGVGQVRDVRFYTSDFGFLLKNSAAPVGTIQRTIDGGKTWQNETTPTNSGLNRLYVCNQNSVKACGEANAATGVLLSAS